jgi:hypothetical protein
MCYLRGDVLNVLPVINLLNSCLEDTSSYYCSGFHQFKSAPIVSGSRRNL